jgi:hypothetical protein
VSAFQALDRPAAHRHSDLPSLHSGLTDQRVGIGRDEPNLLGGTVGYNSEFDRKFVFGFEGDMSWVDASGSAQQIAPFNTARSSDRV